MDNESRETARSLQDDWLSAERVYNQRGFPLTSKSILDLDRVASFDACE